uniref:UBX domain-containing protein 1 n=1 Tax=Aceria tosichella TaxID=561515 RepID=A0A6G1SI74_9ACAR
MDSIKSQLVDMGFTEAKITKAIKSCPEANTLEQVMEWLIAHDGELDTAAGAGSSTADNNNKAANTELAANKADKKSSQAAASPNDDFRPEETAAETAARKKITVEEAQRLITERAAIRAEEDRKKAIEDEKKRRLEGQKMIQTRAELEDLERIRLAQQIRQEKIERELHKKRLLEQIALDRENMKNRTKQMVDSAAPAATKTTSSSSSAAAAPSSSDQSKKAQPKQAATECRIALRFPDGSTKVQKFSPQEQLAAVRLFVQMEKIPSGQTANIEFIAPPNKKLTDSMMNETLDSLGLCPASRLEVKFNQSTWIDLD